MKTRYDLGPSKSVGAILTLCIEMLSYQEMEILTDELIVILNTIKEQEEKERRERTIN